MRHVGRLVAFAMMLTVVGTPGSAAASDRFHSTHQYRLVDLGVLEGEMSDSSAYAINDRGDIVGASNLTNPGIKHAVLWRQGRMIDLGVLGVRGEYENSTAIDVNNHGAVVGTTSTARSSDHAFLWRNGTMIDLGTLGGEYSVASAVNDRGEVVGLSTRADGTWSGFLWRDGRMTDLGILPEDINNQGSIVGSAPAGPSGESRTFLWRQGRITYMPAAEGVQVYAVAVDNRNLVLSQVNLPPADYAAVVWKNATLTDLGGFGAGNTVPLGMNDRGQVVGYSTDAATVRAHAFLWEDGRMVDLTELGVPVEAVPWAVNNRGQIVGTYRAPDGRSHAALFSAR